MKQRVLRIGTRGSRLALWQANHVKALIESTDSTRGVEIAVIKTSGDRIQDRQLLEIGGKGLFVKEIQVALINGDVDLAIHSMKDYPAANPEELALACVPQREDPRDVLVLREGESAGDLSTGARIGTGSLRRRHQITLLFPSSFVSGLRGNVETRLRKLDEGTLDAVVLASAGLKRLGFAPRISRFLSADEMVPAVGQGALAIETRRDDHDLNLLLLRLQDEGARRAVDAERRFLKAIEGDCTTPLGVYASIDGGRVTIKAFLASKDGSEHIKRQIEGSAREIEALVDRLVETFMEAGAGKLLDA